MWTFRGCSSLASAYILGKTTVLLTDFKDSPHLTIHSPAAPRILAYTKEHGIPFEPLMQA